MQRFLAALASLLLLGSVVQAKQPKAADTFVLQTVQGKTLHLHGTQTGLVVDEYKDKVVFLEFWGTHCPPCRISIPHYIDLTKRNPDKLAILAIEVQDTPKATLKQYTERLGINYDIVSYRDAGYFVDYITLRSGWKGSIPYLIVLDPKGNTYAMQVGLVSQKILQRVIDELTSGSTTPSAPSKTPENRTTKPVKQPVAQPATHSLPKSTQSPSSKPPEKSLKTSKAAPSPDTKAAAQSSRNTAAHPATAAQ